MSKTPQIEQCVLGAMMSGRKYATTGLAILSEDDFDEKAHRTIFRAIRLCRDAGHERIGVTTMASMLERHKRLDDIGGEVYLLLCKELAVTPADISDHAKILAEAAHRKRVIELFEGLSKMDGDNPDEMLARAEAKIGEVRSKQKIGATPSFDTLLQEVVTDLSEGARSQSRIKTGFHRFDSYTLGLTRGALSIVAARPGVGKTSYCTQIALNMARKGKKVLIVSCEMVATEIVERMIQQASLVTLHRDGRLDEREDDWRDITGVSATMMDLPITIRDDIRMVDDIASFSRYQAATIGLDVVIVDYMQLLYKRGKHESRRMEVEKVGHELKALAGKLKVPVVGVSQLSRDSVRVNREPQLHDLRESGSLEADAHVVGFLHRDQEDELINNAASVTLLIRKNRSGPTGDVDMKFYPKHTRFEEVD